MYKSAAPTVRAMSRCGSSPRFPNAALSILDVKSDQKSHSRAECCVTICVAKGISSHERRSLGMEMQKHDFTGCALRKNEMAREVL